MGQKWVEMINKHYTEDEIQMANRLMKKMFSIIYYHSNTYQRDNEISPQTTENV